MPQAIELALQLEPGVPFEDQIWSIVHAHGAAAAKELGTALGQGPQIRVRDYQVSKTKQDGSWLKAKENAALEDQVVRWVRERFPPAPAS